MDSFEANKIFGALLGTVFVLFGGSLLAENIFHSEAPEQPGYVIEAVEESAEGGAEEAASVPIAALLQEADAEAGATVFRRCQSCHSAEEGAPAGVGPHLWGVVNRPIASDPGFSYSAAITEFSEGGSVVWDYEHLNNFLLNPRQYISGTAMGFAGISSDGDRADVIAYLRTLAAEPAPLPEPPAEGEAAPAEGEAAPADEAAAPAAEGEAAPAEGAAAPAEGAAAPAEGEAAPAEGAAAPATETTTDSSQPASDQPQAPATTDPAAGAAPVSESPTTGEATDPEAAQPSQAPPAEGAAPTETEAAPAETAPAEPAPADPATVAPEPAPAPGAETPAPQGTTIVPAQ